MVLRAVVFGSRNTTGVAPGLLLCSAVYYIERCIAEVQGCCAAVRCCAAATMSLALTQSSPLWPPTPAPRRGGGAVAQRARPPRAGPLQRALAALDAPAATAKRS